VPVVLKLAKHTTLRLGPVVARVQSAGDLEAAATVMAREVAVAQHLASRGAPAVRPSIDAPPGPHEADGCVISLWSYVAHRAAEETDADAAGAALEGLHAGLASYAGGLPAYTETVAGCATLAEDAGAMLAAAPADRAFLAGLVRAGLARLPADEGRWIALHGDTHSGNVLVTPAGALWADLEAVCRGPLEWDLADKPAGFVANFQAVDAALLDTFGALRRACSAVWCWADAGRSAEIRAAAEYHTAQLRREAAASRFA
jgi:Ser/Thr protein kinase RdoA (MazF antagonist)